MTNDIGANESADFEQKIESLSGSSLHPDSITKATLAANSESEVCNSYDELVQINPFFIKKSSSRLSSLLTSRWQEAILGYLKTVKKAKRTQGKQASSSSFDTSSKDDDNAFIMDADLIGMLETDSHDDDSKALLVETASSDIVEEKEESGLHEFSLDKGGSIIL